MPKYNPCKHGQGFHFTLFFVEQVQNMWHHLMCEIDWTDRLAEIHHGFAAPKSWNIDLDLSGQ